jgi:tetratricopeptide (TPR) repeat protein
MRPAYSNALDSRGLVHLKMGKLDDAIADYTSVLEFQQKNASSLYGRGIANAKKGDEKAARADIEAAKAIDPDIEEDFKRYGVH